MSISNTEELAQAIGKLLVVLAFAFVVRPLAIIYGVNILLSSIGIAVLPYTLLVYLGVLLVVFGIKADISVKE